MSWISGSDGHTCSFTHVEKFYCCWDPFKKVLFSTRKTLRRLRSLRGESSKGQCRFQLHDAMSYLNARHSAVSRTVSVFRERPIGTLKGKIWRFVFLSRCVCVFVRRWPLCQNSNTTGLEVERFPRTLHHNAWRWRRSAVWAVGCTIKSQRDVTERNRHGADFSRPTFSCVRLRPSWFRVWLGSKWYGFECI